jgi:hypothetical protein
MSSRSTNSDFRREYWLWVIRQMADRVAVASSRSAKWGRFPAKKRATIGIDFVPLPRFLLTGSRGEGFSFFGWVSFTQERLYWFGWLRDQTISDLKVIGEIGY